MVTDRPLRDFLSLIDSRKPFSYSRWGKHEWQSLFGERNGFIPKDGFYHQELCEELSRLLQTRPAYALGLTREAVAYHGDKIISYLDGLGIQNLDWYNDPFEVETVEHVQAVIGVFSRVPLLVVGPPCLRRVRNLLRYRAFIDVPPRHQFLCKDDIVRNTLAALEDFRSPALVSVSAGVVAPLVVDELHRRVGGFHQLVDVGGLWEPFARGRT